MTCESWSAEFDQNRLSSMRTFVANEFVREVENVCIFGH